MFLRAEEPPPPGTLIRFELWPQTEKVPIKGVGRIVWTRQSVAELGLPSGVGVKIVRTTANDAARIRSLIEPQP